MTAKRIIHDLQLLVSNDLLDTSELTSVHCMNTVITMTTKPLIVTSGNFQ